MNFKNDFNGGELQAQRDWYNGIEFRSKLESKTAQALDNIGIRYEYEPDGYKLSNGMWYRPDFWLPDAKQFIECKGVMSSTDSAKVVGLVKDTGRQVLVLSYENAMLVTHFFNIFNNNIETYSGIDIGLAKCTKCGKIRFFAFSDTYECTSCGAYDGDHYLLTLATIASATDLFNYGQKTAADEPFYHEIAENFNR